MLTNKDAGWNYELHHTKGEKNGDKDSLYVEITYHDRPKKKSATTLSMRGLEFEYDGPDVIIDLDENDRLIGVEII